MFSGLSFSHASVFINEQQIVHAVSLELLPATTHLLVGPNGSGKSSLVYGLMGHPRYQLKTTSYSCFGIKMQNLAVDERARAGLFLAAQYQPAISGIRVFDFLKAAKSAITGSAVDVAELYDEVMHYFSVLSIDPAFMTRALHEGFSGGEKKRFELLQMLVLRPRVVILDEIDSGLDVTGRALLQNAIELARANNPDTIFLIITHYPDTFVASAIDGVHLLIKGTLVRSAGFDFLDELSKTGFDSYQKCAPVIP